MSPRRAEFLADRAAGEEAGRRPVTGPRTCALPEADRLAAEQAAAAEAARVAADQVAAAEAAADKAVAEQQTSASRPGLGRLTSGFGQRWGRLRAGIDLAAGTGSPVRAAAAVSMAKSWSPLVASESPHLA